MQRQFLSPDQCLVYLESSKPFADVSATHVAKVIRQHLDGDHVRFELRLLTDAFGDEVMSPNTITVTAEKVVSNLSYREISPKQMYQDSEKLTARGFVTKNRDNALINTSRSGLGSGIYGYYRNAADSVIGSFVIDCPNAYSVQDTAHGESITVASLHTNRYLDRVITAAKTLTDISSEKVAQIIRSNNVANLTTLWNIVLYRTLDTITQDTLEEILTNYVTGYLMNVENSYDSLSLAPLYVLPINHIMQYLGYTGIIADDIFGNGWDRGCVCYDIPDADIQTVGDQARY